MVRRIVSSLFRPKAVSAVLPLICLLSLCAMPPDGQALAAPPTFAISDLGVLGGENSESQATAVNSLGQVVGWSGTDTGAIHAFSYVGGSMTDLGTLPGGTNSYAAGVNDAGVIVGRSYVNSMGLLHAVVVQAGVMTDLGLLAGGDMSQATGVNNAGKIVGSASTASGTRAFSYEGGGLVDLGLPPDPLPSDLPPGATWEWRKSAAMAINAAGRIVGSAEFLYNQPPVIANSSLNRGFTFSGTGTMTAFAPDPDAGYDTRATAINAAGLVVGYAYFTNPYVGPAHAFLREDDGIMHDLGALGGDRSAAYGINDSGWIVGQARTASGVDEAFLYVSGVMVALASRVAGENPFLRLETALAINESGSIVGSGLTHEGDRHAFLAIPREAGTAAQGCLPLLLLDE